MDQAAISLVSLALNLLLGGGLLHVWLRYKVQSRGEDRADYTLIIETMKEQRDDAFERIAEQDKRIENLEAEINGLRIARDLDPFPNWVVDLQGCYRFVNREFEAHFLEPKRQTYRDIIGKCHSDLWPDAFCKTIEALNVAARQRPDGTARATTTLDIPRLGTCQVTIHKFPVRFKGAVVAMAGYITVMEPDQQKLGT